MLIIAGSDSGGGAGIQADIKTVAALGGYAMTAVTAITVQNTYGVSGIHAVPDEIIGQQIRTVLDDIGADCIKIGMIGSAAAGNAILDALYDYAGIPMVVDPVMVATSGDRLGDDETGHIIRNRFVPRATVVTPNAPEAAMLADMNISTKADLIEAAQVIQNLGAAAVLAKGGHLDGDEVINVFLEGTSEAIFAHGRIESRHTHGTGCTLASAIAAFIAQGDAPLEACRKATLYVREAIRHAPGFGGGHGPVNHALRPLVEAGRVVSFEPY
ncbi:bifunctional hydroxymethylpyrimidine kinase/phosphomethylpyrimidine kinase [Parvularcula sp. LCG005]|uniref:bifunctional hydroxymethylpyrimidine kinase/phosphomethylpyrimidine kinase n=1 Tax=Parvularcula sp. LCG005 TaxID=3078805 RepID=UPI002942E0F7|nr:bifunctional hydroxymethylpyrimidine kinase/phosphomethylpyrimidine kinase [Parvularcula sp. LCG005]WOI54248.1 bifunctional hydroxymethylpyrimidine kinase/phosphomethylpyrimidine kinase [Parvularcula sp. LCG005]